MRDCKPLASNRLAARVHRIAQPGHQLYTGSTLASFAARQRLLSDVPFGRFPEPSLAMYPLVRFDGASLAMYPLGGFDGASLSTYPCYRRPSFAARISFVPFPRFWLSSPPCGPKTLTYVTFLGFQPEGRESPDRRFPKSVAGFFLQFPFKISDEKLPFRSISRTADFGRLVAIPFRIKEGQQRRPLVGFP